MSTFVDERKSGPIPYHDGHCVFPFAVVGCIGASGCWEFLKEDQAAVEAWLSAQGRDIRFQSL